MAGTMTPDAFAGSLVAVVPHRVLPKIREVYFDAATQLFAAVIGGTHVDTGYNRATFQATAEGDTPADLGPRDPNVDYTSQQAGDSPGAMAQAAKTLTPLTMGFTSDYAAYTEDRDHQVKNARVQWPAIVERAIANAEGSSEGSSEGGR